MAQIYRFTNINKNKIGELSQLNLPLEKMDFSFHVCLMFDTEIEPNNIKNIVNREGVSFIADMRRVPFFSGEQHRHKCIVRALNELNVPVFHVGAAIRSEIDENLPNSVIHMMLSDLVKESDRIHSTIQDYIKSGSCLMILEKNTYVFKITMIILDVIMGIFGKLEIKVNKAFVELTKSEGFNL